MFKKTRRIIVFTVIALAACILIINGIVFFGPASLYGVNYDAEKIQSLTPKEINNKIITIKTAYIVVSVLVLSLSSILAVVLTQSVMLPVKKLMKTAQLIIQGETSDVKYLQSDKEKDQTDELVEMFAGMNAELKENLSEATRQKNEIETILVHMTDGVISFDIKGRITHMNNAAKEALGLNNDNVFEDLTKKLDVNFTMEKIIFLENLTPQEKNVELNDKNYKIFFVPVKNEDNFPDGIVVVIQDVTQYHNLNNMRKRFVADVSHELQTPITSISGFAQSLIQDDNPPIELQKRFLGKILSEASRMSELVKDLLTLSKYDSADFAGQKENINIEELVKERVEILAADAEEKNLKLNCLVTSNIPEIYGDKSGITRIITNIISNAIKYTEEGEVNVYIGFAVKDVYIKVIDTGIGIEEENIPKIFERFYRVEDSRVRNKQGGSGLGLSIVKKIVDQNNGLIEVKSEYGKGTEVVLRFPKADSVA